MDRAVGLGRVGGRLRIAEDLGPDAIHPIILDPKHHVTKLLIKKYDSELLHPGPERFFAEMRRYLRWSCIIILPLKKLLQEQLAGQKIELFFNPPGSPHYGGDVGKRDQVD